ncbi:MAG: glycoside hydrolase family 127 protein [Anaerolineae bacterium]
MSTPIKRSAVPLAQVRIEGGFWRERQEANRTVSLPVEYQRCEETGRFAVFDLDWKPGMAYQPHHFYDSDVAKWIEASAYSLATHPDPALEAQVDEIIARIAGAQQPDGYLNTYYTITAPGQRWSNLRDMHELYCAGHLIEAAVAYYQATGKSVLLDAMRRYADYIATVFGPTDTQLHGYPGHEEIELALVKLYRATGEQRYLDLARFFIDERGRQPHYYDMEARRRGEEPGQAHYGHDHRYNQSHQPVRRQSTAEGHAVRAMYLYSGMADVAFETGDDELAAACRRLWDNLTQRRMYVTGGIGSSSRGERFTVDYDLPNDIAYAETCAAIGVVLFAQRMFLLDGDARYIDVLERALYNGVLSGVSLAGDTFFYANPLSVDPSQYAARPDLYRGGVVAPRRQVWFDCSCCPMNEARLLASVGAYACATEGDTLYVNLYATSTTSAALASGDVYLTQETDYPWDGRVRMTWQSNEVMDARLALRVPGWCRQADVTINGAPWNSPRLLNRGYLEIARRWAPGDTATLELAMPVERVYSRPEVRANAGRVALQRGPLVYALESCDNGPNLDALLLPRNAVLSARRDSDLLGGVVVVSADGLRALADGGAAELYSMRPQSTRAARLIAVPYYAWANREPGEMLVWMREA